MSTDLIRIGEYTVEQYFDSVIKDLATFSVELDDNPLEKGPAALNEKIAQCRRFITRCEKYAMTTSAADAKVKRQVRTLQSEFEFRKSDLYVTNAKVRAGRSDKERDAIINIELKDLLEEISKWSSAADELKILASIIKSTRADLKDVEMRIKDQMNLCIEDIKLGSKWGMSSILEDIPSLSEMDIFNEDAGVDMRTLPRKNLYGSSSTRQTNDTSNILEEDSTSATEHSNQDSKDQNDQNDGNQTNDLDVDDILGLL